MHIKIMDISLILLNNQLISIQISPIISKSDSKQGGSYIDFVWH